MTPLAMLEILQRWRDAGWLRSLDLALARFVSDTDPAAPASLLLGAALVAQLEGQGHSGLPIAALAADAQGLLGWPQAAADEVRETLTCWPADEAALRQAWRDLAAVELAPTDDAGVSPLVVSGGLLYLRRYWRHESRVAAQVLARAAESVGRHRCRCGKGTAGQAVRAAAI